MVGRDNAIQSCEAARAVLVTAAPAHMRERLRLLPLERQARSAQS